MSDLDVVLVDPPTFDGMLADRLTPTQAKAVRQACRGRLYDDVRPSTVEVLVREGLVAVLVDWRGRPRCAELTDDGHRVRSVLLRRAAPEVRAVG